MTLCKMNHTTKYLSSSSAIHYHLDILHINFLSIMFIYLLHLHTSGPE